MKKPKLAVWKFSSCDGCQLSLLDCEDELLEVAGAVEIAYFLEASSATVGGPYDVSLVEGSITTPHDADRIQEVRRKSKTLITIGACATSGGIQALRNFADVNEFVSIVYASPAFISTLATSTGSPTTSRWTSSCAAARSTSASCSRSSRPSSTGAGRTCPGTPSAWSASGGDDLRHRRPRHSVSRSRHAGRLRRDLPSYARGCYGCFGPMETPNTVSLSKRLRVLGMSDPQLVHVFRTFNANAPEFREASTLDG